MTPVHGYSIAGLVGAQAHATTPIVETFVYRAAVAQIARLDAELAEANKSVRIIGLIARHAQDDIDRRDETITRQLAMLDQRDAALEEVTRQHRGAWREVERLRRVCRAAGVEYRTVSS